MKSLSDSVDESLAQEAAKYTWHPTREWNKPSAKREVLPVYRQNADGTYTEMTKQADAAATVMLDRGLIDRILEGVKEIRRTRDEYRHPIEPDIKGFQLAPDPYAPKASFILSKTDMANLKKEDFATTIPMPFLQSVVRMDFSHDQPHINTDFIVRSAVTKQKENVTDILNRMGLLGHFVPVPEFKSPDLENYKTPCGTYDLQKMVMDCGIDLTKLRKRL